jgi:acyl carrier protein
VSPYAGGDIAGEVRRILRELAPVPPSDPLPDDRRMTDVGYDSVRLVELLIECEARFGVAVPGGILDEGPLTVGRLVASLRSALPPRG